MPGLHPSWLKSRVLFVAAVCWSDARVLPHLELTLFFDAYLVLKLDFWLLLWRAESWANSADSF